MKRMGSTATLAAVATTAIGKIARIHEQDPTGVWVMDADGGSPHTLTPSAGDRFYPEWGPGP